MTYTSPDLLDDETAVAEGNLAAMADRVPGWDPYNGHIESPLAEAFAIPQATIVALVKDEARDQYSGFGENVVGVHRGVATAARSQVTIAMADALGHVVPAGYTVVFLGSDGETIPVVTLQDAVAVAPATSVPGVLVAALEPGTVGNGATGAAVDRDPLAFVASVTLEQPTAGGVEEQSLAEHVSRVAAAARRRSFLPLTPDNYADAALDVPGVFRCLALNKVNPASAGVLQTGHITLIAVDAAGNAVGSIVDTAIVAHFNAMDQVLGAVPHTAPPVVVAPDVAVSVRAAVLPGGGGSFTSAAVQAAVTASVRGLLNKATYNADPTAPGGWRKSSGSLTIFDVDARVSDLPEVRQVVSVTFNGSTASIALAAEALVNAGLVTVTVVP